MFWFYILYVTKKCLTVIIEYLYQYCKKYTIAAIFGLFLFFSYFFKFCIYFLFLNTIYYNYYLIKKINYKKKMSKKTKTKKNDKKT